MAHHPYFLQGFSIGVSEVWHTFDRDGGRSEGEGRLVLSLVSAFSIHSVAKAARGECLEGTVFQLDWRCEASRRDSLFATRSPVWNQVNESIPREAPLLYCLAPARWQGPEPALDMGLCRI